MNQRLFFRFIAPALAVGVLFLAASALSIRYLRQLQGNLGDILASNVVSLGAAQELELAVRQLRLHNLLHLLDPAPARLARVDEYERRFEAALAQARAATADEEEARLIRRIEAGFEEYRAEQVRLRGEPRPRSAFEVAAVVDSHPVQLVVEPCRALYRLNKDRMERTAAESQEATREGFVVMIIFGLFGPVVGLGVGVAISRGFRQSIYRLSVRVQDIAQHLDRELGTVSVIAGGDLQHLERQMQLVVSKVEQAAERLRHQHRQLVRAEQLSLVGQLAAGVAHEVRNPLTGVKMLVEAALRPGSAGGLAGEDLRVVYREVLRLEQIVQSFLNFARLPTPQVAPCDLGALVGEAWELVRARAGQQRVEMRVEQPRPVHVAADAGQLKTVLVNLFLNSLDAMPDGGRVEVLLEAGSPGPARLAVCDTGPGIAPAVLDRLFEPFTTTKPQGTGLGLSLSRRIVEEHGGTIAAANRSAGGVCFSLTLPAA